MKERPSGYFDGTIYPLFRAAAVPLLYYLTPEPESLRLERTQFLSNSIVNPRFTYTRLATLSVGTRRAQLETVGELISRRSDLTSSVKTLYRRIINQERHKLSLLEALQTMLEDQVNESAQVSFREATTTLYGEPGCSLFLHAVEVLGLQIAKASPECGYEADFYRALDRLKELVTSYGELASRCPLKLRSRPEVRVGEGQLVTDEAELWGYFNNALHKLSLRGWRLAINQTNTRTTFAVSLKDRTLKCPSFRNLQKRSRKRAMTTNMIDGLIAHELGTHALRYEHGLQSPLNLLATGLDQYEQGAEGLASYREQQCTGTSDYAGLTYYLAAGLGTGVGSRGKDFRAVFSIMTDYYLVTEPTTLDRARDLAWEITLRVFRGTPGNVAGLVFTKDVIYREGNALAWEFFPAAPELSEDVYNIGKYDPTNREHARILAELDLIPHSLVSKHERLCLPRRDELLLCYPELTANVVKY